MALLFLDGCDHYDARAELADKWTQEDIVSVNTTGGRFGGGALVLAPIFDEVYMTIPGLTEVFAGCHFNTPSIPTLEEVMAFLNGSSIQIAIQVTQSGQIKVLRGGTIIDGSAGGVIHTNTWHTIEVRVVHHDTTGVVQVRIDGEQVIDFLGDTIPSGAADIDRVEFRAPSLSGNVTMDDFYILDTTGSAPQNTFLGDWRIDTLYPDGDGNYTEFNVTNPASPTTHWDKVEETPTVDDNSYNETNTNADRDTFTMGNLAAITAQTILSLQQVSRAESSVTGASNMRNKLRISGSDFNGATQGTTLNVFAYLLELWDLDPNAGPGPWTETVINGIESGFEHVNTNTTRVSQHCVEVLRQNTAPLLRVSQVGIQVLRQATDPQLRVSQVGVQVMRSQLAAPSGRVTQIALEVAREEPISEGIVTQLALEVARVHIPGAQPGLRSWMVFDPIHSVDVHLVSGIPPTSVASEAVVLNGANVGILGTEIIQWRDVVDLGGNIYRLSHLLRGRLGTEVNMNAHSIGELFAVLDADTVRRITMDITDLDIQRFYKIIGSGLTSFGAPITGHINTGVSQHPWQPVFFEATRAGDDITFTWERRSRIGHQRILQVSPPIGEEDERYEVSILDGTDSEVRKIEVTDTTAVYLGTEQETDFGAGNFQNPVRAIVYQMSRVVGRGFGNRQLL